MTYISRGGDDVVVPDTYRADEIGAMARATQVFHDTMRANEAARLEQQRLISAFNQVVEQVAIFGPEGHVLFMNMSFCEFNQPILASLDSTFTHEEFLREGLAQGAFEDVGDAAEEWLATKLQANDIAPFEIRCNPGRILLATQSQVPGIGTVFSAKDITARRNSELQLIQASKMVTLGEMATGMAHELNQPLGVIRMAASNSLKRMEKGSVDPSYLGGKFERIAEQTERAAEIIDHMRIFGRKAEGKAEPFDLCASVRQVA
jgi:signal transduction histidine kinase